jgi:hypothetical protein
MCGSWWGSVKKISKNESLRQFDEASARSYASSALQLKFSITNEVNLTVPVTGERFRLDMLAICKERGYLVGFEFKGSSLFPAEFADALRQAANYREAIISDIRLPLLKDRRLDCCVVFPDWTGLHDDGKYPYQGHADGMRLLAGHFRVGAMRLDERSGALRIILNQSAVWHSVSGWTANSDNVLRGKRRRGSVKRIE